MSSAASSASWSKPPSGRLSRPSSCPTAASVPPRTRAAAVLISGFVSDARSWSRRLSSGGQEQNSLIGLTSFITRDPPMLPRLNRRRAQFVLTKIDEILAWEQRKEAEKDTRFVELGRYLCEVRAGQYWRLESLKCFDEFLERRFPESRRKAYYLMSIHEHLPPQVRRELKEVGWTKAGAGEAGEEPGWAGVRLCNLVAQSSRAAKGTVPARGRKRAYRERNRALGDYLFQTLQKPDPGHRAGARDGSSDARKRSLSRLLPGDDLRGFFGGSEFGQR